MDNKEKKENEVVNDANTPAEVTKKFVTQPEKDCLAEIEKRKIEYLNATSELGDIESEVHEKAKRREVLLKEIPEKKKNFLSYQEKILGEMGKKYGNMIVDPITGELQENPQQ